MAFNIDITFDETPGAPRFSEEQISVIRGSALSVQSMITGLADGLERFIETA